MCGIAGVLRVGGLTPADLAAAERMKAALGHRGPDGSGIWSDPKGGIVLAHTRLAILDLSSAGEEPILSSDGESALTFNGEILNHVSLRERIGRPLRDYRGHCDAETLVELWNAEGAAALASLRGFFAFAVWERREGILTLVRDRLGKKPLYYVDRGSHVLFASEIRALLAAIQGPVRLDVSGLAYYLAIGAVPAPCTIVEGVSSLTPGSYIRFGGGVPRLVKRWWRPPKQMDLSVAPEEVVPALRELLQASVEDRLLADAPVGAFLSGGLDSTVITALMRAATGSPLDTFTVGFGVDVDAGDEAQAAAEVAASLGCRHHQVTIEGQQLQDLFHRFLDALDQPAADAFNTFLVAGAVQDLVKVVLTGVGADELLYGYNFWRLCARWASLRRVLDLLPADWRWRLAETVGWTNATGRGGRAAKAVSVMLAPESGRMLLPPRFRSALLAQPRSMQWAEGWVRSQMGDVRDPGRLADLACYLSPVLLSDLDTMTMSYSLEARAPFLDHRLVEWALRLPPSATWDPSGGKAPLRQLAHTLVPQVSHRPKRGFELPLGKWMEAPLADDCRSLIADLGKRSFISPGVLAELVASVSGHRRDPRSLWHLLILEGWLQRHPQVITD